MKAPAAIGTAVAFAAALAPAAGCASLASSSSAGTVALPSDGRTTGRVVVPGGADTTIRLTNRGPGAVDFSVRMASGVELQSGALDAASVRFTPAARVVIVAALQARPGSPSTVEWRVDGAGGAAFEWEAVR
jgi:hypothetical protein